VSPAHAGLAYAALFQAPDAARRRRLLQWRDAGGRPAPFAARLRRVGGAAVGAPPLPPPAAASLEPGGAEAAAAAAAARACVGALLDALEVGECLTCLLDAVADGTVPNGLRDRVAAQARKACPGSPD
jgi:hypothetical protein